MSNFFDKSEYADRLRRVKSAMAERDIDVLLICEPSNLLYLTGYDALSASVPQCAFVAQDMDEPCLMLREQDSFGAPLSVYLKPENIIGYDESLISDSSQNPWDFMIRTLFERCGDFKTIGVEKHSIFLGIYQMQLLENLLKSKTIEDVTGLVNWRRIIKSPQEREYMRQSGAITDAALRRASEVIKAGVRESDAAGEIYKVLVSGTEEFSALPPLGFFMPANERTITSHLNWTGEPYEPGSQVNLELGANRNWYAAGGSRTYVVGQPSDELARLADCVNDGMGKAADMLKPGAPCSASAIAFRDALARAGYEKPSRIGYSIGLTMVPTWIEHTASLAAEDNTEIQAGMVFHMILGMWGGKTNYVISETFEITEQGASSLCSLPREIICT